MATNYPPRLAPESMPWARLVDRRQDAIEGAIALTEKNSLVNSKQNTSTFTRLQQQVAALNAAAEIAQDDNGATSGTGWFNGDRATVTITSPTGRVEIQYGGTINTTSEGYCCYSASGGASIARETFTSGSESYQMITVSTGTIGPQSVYRTQVVDVTPGVPTTFRVEFLVSAGRFNNGSIYARSIL